MLSEVEARGRAAGVAAADRLRRHVADALRTELPGVVVEIAGESVTLTGRIMPDDARLRWIGSLLL